MSLMHCLRCKGFMMVERHYTLVNRRLYARCLNCGFWIDLADLLRFFHKVIDSGFRGGKVRESYHTMSRSDAFMMTRDCGNLSAAISGLRCWGVHRFAPDRRRDLHAIHRSCEEHSGSLCPCSHGDRSAPVPSVASRSSPWHSSQGTQEWACVV